MKFKNNKVSRINIAGIVAIIIMTIILLIGSCSFIIVKKLNYYKKATFGNTYIEDNYIGNLEYDKLEKKINSMSDELVNKKIVLEYGDNQIETTYKDLGFKAQNNEIIKQIKSKQENMNIIKKIKHCFRPSKKEYKIKLKTDKNKLTEYINNVKNTYDRGKTEEKFEIDENRNIKYIEGKSSLSLDVEKTKEKLLKDINSDKIEKNYKLVYQEEQVEVHDNYKYIDTKVSSFTTEFNPYISRGTNLRTGLAYIDGVILEPGEVFSFYKYAGPYNKRGYVFYYEFVGNDVCQIATTT